MFMNLNKERFCVLLIIAITILQMASISKIINFQPLIAVFGILLVVFAYKSMSASFHKIAGVFLILGAIINIYTKQPLSTWMAGVNYMLNITAILVIMQLFVIPIRLGDYAGSLKYIISKVVKSERSAYLFTMIIIHLFSSFLLFGTIPVMLSLLGEPLKKIVKDYNRFMSTALTRSYAMVVMWAPGAVNILLVMNATGAKWIDIFFLGTTLAILGLVLSYLFELPHLRKEIIESAEVGSFDNNTLKKAFRKVYSILFVIVALIFLILLFDWLKIGNNTSRVMLASLLISICWLGTFIKHPHLKSEVKEYYTVSLIKTVDLAVLYIALGVFAKAIETSGLLAYFYPYIAVVIQNSGIFMIPIIACTLFLCSLIGLHPFVLLMILGKLLVALSLPFSPAILAVSLIFGSTLSYMISPFAGIVLTTSKFLNIPINQVGLKWNFWFGVTYFVLGCCCIMYWQYLPSFPQFWK